MDTTAFPGDTLLVPVNPQISAVLDRYPLPNDPQGPFGARTYAAPSPVSTVTDQFSFRIDHRISDQAQFFARFTLKPSHRAVDQSRSDGHRPQLSPPAFSITSAMAAFITRAP